MNFAEIGDNIEGLESLNYSAMDWSCFGAFQSCKNNRETQVQGNNSHNSYFVSFKIFLSDIMVTTFLLISQPDFLLFRIN